LRIEFLSRHRLPSGTLSYLIDLSTRVRATFTLIRTGSEHLDDTPSYALRPSSSPCDSLFSLHRRFHISFRRATPVPSSAMATTSSRVRRYTLTNISVVSTDVAGIVVWQQRLMNYMQRDMRTYAVKWYWRSKSSLVDIDHFRVPYFYKMGSLTSCRKSSSNIARP
jgi:hypothetical protein